MSRRRVETDCRPLGRSENTEHQWTRVTQHARLGPTKRGQGSPEPQHSVGPSACRPPPSSVSFTVKGGGRRGLRGAGECWREPSDAEAGQVGTDRSLPLASKLVHDAVCVVDGDGAVLTQTLPLESRAEGAHLVLLVLLLLGELHEHLF